MIQLKIKSLKHVLITEIRVSCLDDFPEQIDREARRLLQVLPAFDPSVGRVSGECKRHADIFHRELAKFTLWALKSKYNRATQLH